MPKPERNILHLNLMYLSEIVFATKYKIMQYIIGTQQETADTILLVRNIRFTKLSVFLADT